MTYYSNPTYKRKSKLEVLSKRCDLTMIDISVKGRDLNKENTGIDNNFIHPKDHFIRYRTKEKPLTYLVGAKCIDGIVIVSDSRLIAEYDVETGNKILQLDENIVIGAAGGTRFFKQFLHQLNDELKENPQNQ